MARRQGPSAFAPLSGTPRLALWRRCYTSAMTDEGFLTCWENNYYARPKSFFYCLALSFAPLTGATARAIPVPNGSLVTPRQGEGGDEVGFSTYYDGPDSLSLRDNSASLDGS